MTQDLAFAENALSLGSINSYISWVNKIPLLTFEEEQELAENLQNNNDLSSARKMILSHLRLVVSIARGYNGYGLSQSDLIQEGNIGLMKAVKRFRPEVGVRLVSFAIHWIRAEIHEYIIRNWRIVKIATTKAQRKLFFNLRKAAKERGWFSDKEIDIVANNLNVSHKEVRQMEQRLNNFDQSFDVSEYDDDNTASWGAPANYLEDHSQNLESNIEDEDWENQRQQQLHSALSKLDDRSQDILKQRWLNDAKPTLHDLATKYNVSAERIRQLEKNAMKKVKESIT